MPESEQIDCTMLQWATDSFEWYTGTEKNIVRVKKPDGDFDA